MNHGRAVDRPMGWAGVTFFSRRQFARRAARPARLSGRSHIRPLPLSRGSSGGEKIGMGLDEPDRATDCGDDGKFHKSRYQFRAFAIPRHYSRVDFRKHSVAGPAIAGLLTAFTTAIWARSDARSVGNECVRKFTSRWLPYH